MRASEVTELANNRLKLAAHGWPTPESRSRSRAATQPGR